jgi:hypothetical protein
MTILAYILAVLAIYLTAGLILLLLAGLSRPIATWWNLAPEPQWMYKGAALAIWPYVLYRAICIYLEKE